MKKDKPCGNFVSADPGAGSHQPDPCINDGWSRADHDAYWHDQDLKNDILQAVNDALEGTGFSIARSTIDEVDGYSVVKGVTVILPSDPECHHDFSDYVVCKKCGKTAAATGDCHHCADPESVRNRRCWWCLRLLQ